MVRFCCSLLIERIVRVNARAIRYSRMYLLLKVELQLWTELREQRLGWQSLASEQV